MYKSSCRRLGCISYLALCLYHNVHCISWNKRPLQVTASRELMPEEAQAATLINAWPLLDARSHCECMPRHLTTPHTTCYSICLLHQVRIVNYVAILHHCNCMTVMFIAFFSSNSQFSSNERCPYGLMYVVASDNARFLLPARSVASSAGRHVLVMVNLLT